MERTTKRSGQSYEVPPGPRSPPEAATTLPCPDGSLLPPPSPEAVREATTRPPCPRDPPEATAPPPCSGELPEVPHHLLMALRQRPQPRHPVLGSHRSMPPRPEDLPGTTTRPACPAEPPEPAALLPSLEVLSGDPAGGRGPAVLPRGSLTASCHHNPSRGSHTACCTGPLEAPQPPPCPEVPPPCPEVPQPHCPVPRCRQRLQPCCPVRKFRPSLTGSITVLL
ncbi:hypothetical protein SKAU_G00156400 [Synaphobranchus kaupii]|uniref:Uncharacterized protein n=1 Tax=Synaphobranchus kaupii TaxID=118154 RepID=A0A9Q1IZB4_SYNKA|nr:hypothetical protein SKAU_G00156400 [Synaphobranchus kaupii]